MPFNIEYCKRKNIQVKTPHDQLLALAPTLKFPILQKAKKCFSAVINRIVFRILLSGQRELLQFLTVKKDGDSCGVTVQCKCGYITKTCSQPVTLK